jgi:sigma-B regulation protein RsbU (phosphoserine phosphatase)
MKNVFKIRKISLKAKFSAASMLLAVILCVAIILVSYYSYRDAMFDRYKENITSLVHTAATMVPADKVDTYFETMETDEEYDRMIENFRIIQEENNLEYLYSYVPTEEGLKVFAQGTVAGEVGHFTLGDVLGTDYYPQEDLDSAMLLFTDPNQPKIYITSDSAFGYLITAFEVIRDEAGNPILVVGADMSMSVIGDTLMHYILLVSIISLFIFALFITIYLYFLRKELINPLQLIVDGATDFVNTNMDDDLGQIMALDLKINTGDEIEILAQAFNQMTSDIIRYINELTQVTSERERIETELRIATLIQEGMLPQDFEFPGRSDIGVFASMKAAKEVGGDFYDFFFVDEEHFCIVIGDVSGKGVPAALFMAMSKATVKDLVLRRLPVDEVMSQANKNLCKNNEQGMFVTLFIAIIEIKTGRIEWCDAGHNPTIVWKKDGRVEILKGKKGFVCAGLETAKYKMNEDYIEAGDILYLYTDGVTEANNVEKELYGEERLYQLIENLKKREIKELCTSVLVDLDDFTGEEAQFDDITMLGFEIKESGWIL